MIEKLKTIFSDWADSAFILFLLPLFGYLFGYSFQLGYLGYYGFDYFFVDVDIRSTALGGILSLLLILLMAFVFGIIHKIFYSFNFDDPVYKRIGLSLLLILASVFFYYTQPLVIFVVFAALFILLIIGIFIPGKDYFSGNISYKDSLLKIEADNQTRAKNIQPRPSIFKAYLFAPAILPFSYFIIVGLFCFISGFLIGSGFAGIKSSYFVYESNSNEYIIVWKNSGEYLAVKYDPSTNQLQNTYLLLNPASNLNFKLVHTNKLFNTLVQEKAIGP